MFTGIVEELGTVVAREGERLVVRGSVTSADAAIGDSLAIDGVCLTVVEVAGERLAFDAVPETLSRSTLGGLDAGSDVNLEPALRAGDQTGENECASSVTRRTSLPSWSRIAMSVPNASVFVAAIHSPSGEYAGAM